MTAVPERVYVHLRAQYAGVLDEEQIERHVQDYIGPGIAAELLSLVRRHAPAARHLLDVGCGYGAFVLAAREEGLDAVGVDLAPFEIAFARQRLAGRRPHDDAAQVYREASAVALPFADSSFDAVCLWNVLEHVPDAGRVLDEASRVLRPGGRLFVICPNYAALRREAHYHVAWPPLLPRSLASRYLRWRGRDPAFFEQHIFYRTNLGVLAAVWRRGYRVESAVADKLRDPGGIRHPRVRAVLAAVARARLLWLARAAVRLELCNPLRPSVCFVAVRR